ncbi:MAG: hypothetical protein UX91_C0006G0058 [Candidatus Amesbacteria bacterium GW2011_GWB1_47_19]|nr:MAG: hypothetical protein UW51_C0002G0058 [Candidatus Amesbacteria bacterium GW2011_GWA1_44_24]KKU31351.1 MAG: hypothetical protein UX46_C0006G0143 [Candidatus Amesbacteria bacterium GW2011_GWC1_46_24]KKU66996.1 MAG: hypothetical protein UX91_C0006G0058 [Candidatus Amesbacteria bacterium GW2011_GWB1_47_19]
MVCLLGINLAYVISGVRSYPLNSVDVYGIWMFKAKAWYLHQGFPLADLTNPVYSYSHPQYPLLLPYLFVNLFRLAGSYREMAVLAVYPLVYALILLMVYRVLLHLEFSRPAGLFFTYIYSMLSPLLAQAGRKHAGNADIIICALYWLAILLFFRLYRRGPVLLGWLLTLLVIVSSQIKIEGAFLAVLIIFIPVRFRFRLGWLILIGLPAVAWYLAQRSFGIIPDYFVFLPSVTVLLSRSVIIFQGVLRHMLNFRNWYIFWPLFWLILPIHTSNSRDYLRITNRVLLSVTGLFFINYLFSTISTAGYVSSTADRLMLQVSPFFYPLFAVKTREIFASPL